MFILPPPQVFPGGKECSDHEMSYSSSLDLCLCRRRLCLDGAGSVFACLHVQQTVHCEAVHSDSVLSRCLEFKMKEHPRKGCASRFIAALKNHSVSHGNDCAMSCAFTNNPHPTVTLYKGNISITSKSKLWFSSTSSICLLMIPTTCSCKLIICGKSVCSHCYLLGMIPSRLNNHRLNVSEYGLHPAIFQGRCTYWDWHCGSHFFGPVWLSVSHRGRDCSVCSWSCKGHIVRTYLHIQKQPNSDFVFL